MVYFCSIAVGFCHSLLNRIKLRKQWFCNKANNLPEMCIWIKLYSYSAVICRLIGTGKTLFKFIQCYVNIEMQWILMILVLFELMFSTHLGLIIGFTKLTLRNLIKISLFSEMFLKINLDILLSKYIENICRV